MKKGIIVCMAAALVVGTAYGGMLKDQDVSATAKWAVHFDMEKFLASKIGKLVTDETANPELKKGLEMLREKIGFDPMKNVSSVTLYGEDYRNGGGVAIIKGPANTDTITSLEKMIAGTKTHEQISYGPRVIHSWVDEHKKKPAAICFYAPGVTLAGGDTGGIKAAIDVLDGKKAGLKAGFGLKMPGNGGFLAIAADKYEGRIGNKAKAAVLQNADWVALSVGNSGENVDLDLKLGANTEENSRQMEQVVRGLIAFMSLSRDQNPVAADIAKAVSVNVDNGTVGVKFSYSSESLYKLIKAMKQRRGPNQNAVGQQKPENTDGAAGNQLFKF